VKRVEILGERPVVSPVAVAAAPMAVPVAAQLVARVTARRHAAWLVVIAAVLPVVPVAVRLSVMSTVDAPRATATAPTVPVVKAAHAPVKWAMFPQGLLSHPREPRNLICRGMDPGKMSALYHKYSGQIS
jgi:hypothetical protein